MVNGHSFTKNCPSTILLKGRNEKNDANVLSIVASILYQICIKKSIHFEDSKKTIPICKILGFLGSLCKNGPFLIFIAMLRTYQGSITNKKKVQPAVIDR